MGFFDVAMKLGERFFTTRAADREIAESKEKIAALEQEKAALQSQKEVLQAENVDLKMKRDKNLPTIDEVPEILNRVLNRSQSSAEQLVKQISSKPPQRTK